MPGRERPKRGRPRIAKNGRIPEAFRLSGNRDKEIDMVHTLLLQFGWLTLHCLPTLSLVVAILSATVQHGEAQNMGFTPGDAFFVFDLTEKLVSGLPEKGGEVTLYYPTPLIGFSGYAGFDKLRLEGVTPELVQYLRRVYQDHRKWTPKIVRIDVSEDGTRSEVELNPPIAFLYNADVDWSQQRIALKYNEDWPQLPAEAFAGPNRKQSFGGEEVYNHAEVYQPLVKTYDAVTEDWRNARRFPGLRVEVPKNVAWGRALGQPVTEAVIARCKDVQFVVITDEALEDYFLREPGLSFYQITVDGISEREWRVGDEGIELIRKELGADEVSRSTTRERKLLTRYHGYVYYRMVREDVKNGDITIPIWPDCRYPVGAAGWETPVWSR